MGLGAADAELFKNLIRLGIFLSKRVAIDAVMFQKALNVHEVSSLNQKVIPNGNYFSILFTMLTNALRLAFTTSEGPIILRKNFRPSGCSRIAPAIA